MSTKSTPPTFEEWLAQTYPNVILTPTQQLWTTWFQDAHDGVMSYGRSAGRTFFLKLWSEYSGQVYR